MLNVGMMMLNDADERVRSDSNFSERCKKIIFFIFTSTKFSYGLYKRKQSIVLKTKLEIKWFLRALEKK